MIKFPLNSTENSFRDLAQHAISCIDALATKIERRDYNPILDRLRRGNLAETSSRLEEEANPFQENAASRLAEYDYHIALVEEALRKLKSAGDDFKHSIDLTMSLFAPVRRLPEDVLVETFSLYIQDCEEPGERTYSLSILGEGRVFSPSFALSHVCSFWRRVVFSRPTFWSSFSLDLGALRAWKEKSKIMTILSECLSRSANAPLSLRLRLKFKIDNHDLDQEEAFILFMGQAARCEHLGLSLNDQSIFQFDSWLKSEEHPPLFSSLKHLSLDGGFSYTATFLPILLRSSHLETLTTSNLELSWSDFSQCDLSTLRILESSGLSEGSMSQFLGCLPSLEVCNLASTSKFTADPQPSSTLYSSNLRCLSIYLENPVSELCQSLCTPRLLCLSLKAGDNVEGSHIKAISLMLIRSKSVLQDLTLFNIYAHEALDFIDAQPSVTDVTLSGDYGREDDYKYPGDLFSRLTILKDGNETILGPNLQFLTVQIKGVISIAEFARALAQEIVEMVISRTDAASLPPGVSALRRISIRFNSIEYEDVFNHIRASLGHLVASGLQLELNQHFIGYSHF